MSQKAIAQREYIVSNAVGPSPKTICTVNGVEVKALADIGSEVTTINNHYKSNISDQYLCRFLILSYN